MQLIDFLSVSTIYVQLHAPSKKRALEIMSQLAAAKLNNTQRTSEILDALLQRERLGSTVIGHGVAIPHCRLAGLERPIIVIITLAKGIDFQDHAHQPVELLIGLIIPHTSDDLYLSLLANIAEQCSHLSFIEQIKAAENEKTLYNIMANLTHV